MPIFHSQGGVRFDVSSAEEAALQIVKEAIEKKETLGQVVLVTNGKNEEIFFSTDTLVEKLDEAPGPRLAQTDEEEDQE
ncbi:MAG: hypothetical protein O7F12_10705 [Nitrospirae bacterium]|nr:hypothetical protein [Nitrospirota bacterium]